MGRSSDEKGAEKAVQIRRSQQKERVRLQSEIAAEQKIIAQVNEERAPIAAEVRKVEAEVGPIKYIAHLLYGENPDANILEKAVIWVTVLIVIVLDPLAVVLLLASQYSFQRFRELEEPAPIYVVDVGEPPSAEEKEAEGDSPSGPIVDVVSPDTTVTTSTLNYTILDDIQDPDWAETPEITITHTANSMVISNGRVEESLPVPNVGGPLFVQNEEQQESGGWNKVISEQEYREQVNEKIKNDSKNNTNNTA
jgi:hypothetical protein